VLTPEFASSFGRLTANHLWQSTAFAAVAVLLALALRANHARARYWLWLAASAKFLVPFSTLAAIGAALGRWLIPAPPAPRFPFVMEQIVQPFTPMPYPSLPAAPSAPSAASLLPALLLSLWLCGFLAVLIYAWTRWRRVAAAVRSATPLTEGRELEALRKVFRGVGLQACHAGVRAGVLRGCGSAALWGRRFRLPTAPRLVSSTANLEPGVFGIFRPILWLPAGIAHRLEDAELEAILAHELCHIRRRDNLLATLHLLVESIFWFHPLVWWLGARLEEERERACDEEVVRLGGEPQIYAESILKVCEFYLASPVPCAAGVTGGELKKRIEGIMTNPLGLKMGLAKRALLAMAGLAAVTLPLALGVTHAAELPRFEVASIKPSVPGPDGRLHMDIEVYPGGRIILRARTLKGLVCTAFQLSCLQVSGGEDWTRKDLYDIEAKPSTDMQRSIKDLRHTVFDIEDEHLREMLQALLIDRFQLKYHRESKTRDVYLLERSAKALKLRPSEIAPASPDPTEDRSSFGGIGYVDGEWGLFRTSMPQLAKFAYDRTGTPVLDRTGLSGPFDYRQAVPDDEPAYSGPAHIDSFMNMLSTVGLKLERSKGPVETLVIDKVEKPSAN
jgi:uncharacterized protein (TIGR03435 family)